MFVQPPRCGNLREHQQHYWGMDTMCQGWTGEQEAVEKLCGLVAKWAQLTEIADPEDRDLQLHVHPLVHRLLMMHIEPHFSSAWPESMVYLPPTVKVVVDNTLPKGSWRFEIARGTM